MLKLKIKPVLGEINEGVWNVRAATHLEKVTNQKQLEEHLVINGADDQSVRRWAEVHQSKSRGTVLESLMV